MFKKPICVVDVGAKTVTVLVGHKKKDASFEILGLAEADAIGIENGDLRGYHLLTVITCQFQDVQKIMPMLQVK